jgi:hypothetical protein
VSTPGYYSCVLDEEMETEILSLRPVVGDKAGT